MRTMSGESVVIFKDLREDNGSDVSICEGEVGDLVSALGEGLCGVVAG
jgi:hypothetical protein